MKIAIASGKGGTGKTLLATNLAWRFAEQGQADVTYVDCDVEAPNGHLFLHPEISKETRLSVTIPELIPDRCSGCRECQQFCQFNAILAISPGEVMVFPELCHTCGGCILACPDKALKEVPVEVGTLQLGWAGKVRTEAGILDIGQPRGTPLIDALIDDLPADETVVIDAPPGTSCLAVSAIRGADFVILVTEPTPFGAHDLQLAIETVRIMGKPMAAVINRSDVGDDEVRRLLEAEGVPLLAELPFDAAIAEAYARGELAATKSEAFLEILDQIISESKGWGVRKGAA